MFTELNDVSFTASTAVVVLIRLRMGRLRAVLPAMLWPYHRPRRRRHHPSAVVLGAQIPQMQEAEATGAVASTSAENQMGAVAAFVTHAMVP